MCGKNEKQCHTNIQKLLKPSVIKNLCSRIMFIGEVSKPFTYSLFVDMAFMNSREINLVFQSLVPVCVYYLLCVRSGSVIRSLSPETSKSSFRIQSLTQEHGKFAFDASVLGLQSTKREWAVVAGWRFYFRRPKYRRCWTIPV